MGSTLAQAFVAGGHDVTAWNRSEDLAAERLNRLNASGVRVTAVAAEAVAASPLIVACVLDYNATFSALDQAGVADAVAGRSLLCLCSGEPQGARDVSEWVGERGGSYLDGGIVGYPRHVGGARTVFIYSGDRKVFDAHLATLEALAGDARYLGADPGAAKSVYLALWPYYYSSLAGFLESAALAQSVGMPVAEFQTLAPHLAALALEHVQEAAGRVERGDYSGDQASVDVHWKGFLPIVDAFAEADLSARMTDAFVAYLDAARAAGDGSSDVASIFKQIVGRQ
jgi:3-hydroxyisobutyrate dehydrogenase-like beta-hydroxyacid dehydrogenase